MFYIAECPFEPNGSLGIWKCSDGKTLMILCDECNAMWLHPLRTTPAEALKVGSPPHCHPESSAPIFGAGSGWATKDEIVSKGWMPQVAGEGKALDEL